MSVAEKTQKNDSDPEKELVYIQFVEPVRVGSVTLTHVAPKAFAEQKNGSRAWRSGPREVTIQVGKDVTVVPVENVTHFRYQLANAGG